MKSIRIAVTVAALITTACSGASASPSASAPGAAAASASSSANATASPTPLATAFALPEGTYQTAPIPTATLEATAEAAGFTWDAARWPEATTVYTVRLEGGRWLWFCSADGASAALCSEGTYVVTNDHTITYTDAEDPSSTFILTFTLDGDVLTTHVDPGPGAGIEAIIFYNSAPFVRQP
jgi:glucose/arabinose dehydrogenase